MYLPFCYCDYEIKGFFTEKMFYYSAKSVYKSDKTALFYVCSSILLSIDNHNPNGFHFDVYCFWRYICNYRQCLYSKHWPRNKFQMKTIPSLLHWIVYLSKWQIDGGRSFEDMRSLYMTSFQQRHHVYIFST